MRLYVQVGGRHVPLLKRVGSILMGELVVWDHRGMPAAPRVRLSVEQQDLLAWPQLHVQSRVVVTTNERSLDAIVGNDLGVEAHRSAL